MKFKRMPIEIEAPEQMGYANIRYNLTESSYTDSFLKDLDINLSDLELCYGNHIGHEKLRELLAKEEGLKAQDVLLTPGAAGALFFIANTFLNKGDRLLVEFPNYGTNIETPRTLGAELDFIEVSLETNFMPSLAQIKEKITPQTKLISLTVPHNPTGTCVSLEFLKSVIALSEDKKIPLLVDETYRDMNFDNQLPTAASLSTNVISVSSLSKTYGLPGIRLGWLFCQNQEWMEQFLAVKEQVVICGSMADEEIAYQFLLKKEKHLKRIKESILTRRKILCDWLVKEKNIEAVTPVAGVVCFPRIKNISDSQLDFFYKILNSKYGTYVGPGHWFAMDKRYMRLGYGWPKDADLKQGLENISLCLQESLSR